MPRRLRLDVAERRAQLLELGLQMFAERPFDDVSLDDIAKRARISRPLLYHYFPSKRDFYVAIASSAASQFDELTALSPDLSPVDQLTAALDNYLSYVKKHADAYHVLMSREAADPLLHEIVEAARTRTIERICRGLGVDRPNEALKLALRGWVGFFEGAISAWLRSSRPPKATVVRILSSTLLFLTQLSRDSG